MHCIKEVLSYRNKATQSLIIIRNKVATSSIQRGSYSIPLPSFPAKGTRQAVTAWSSLREGQYKTNPAYLCAEIHGNWFNPVKYNWVIISIKYLKHSLGGCCAGLFLFFFFFFLNALIAMCQKAQQNASVHIILPKSAYVYHKHWLRKILMPALH